MKQKEEKQNILQHNVFPKVQEDCDKVPNVLRCNGRYKIQNIHPAMYLFKLCLILICN